MGVRSWGAVSPGYTDRGEGSRCRAGVQGPDSLLGAVGLRETQTSLTGPRFAVFTLEPGKYFINVIVKNEIKNEMPRNQH